MTDCTYREDCRYIDTRLKRWIAVLNIVASVSGGDGLPGRGLRTDRQRRSLSTFLKFAVGSTKERIVLTASRQFKTNVRRHYAFSTTSI